MRTCFSSMAVLLALIAIGCAPMVDLEAERASVLETDKEWASAMVAKDLDRTMSFVADDATLFPPDAPILEGKKAIRDYLAELLTQPEFSASWAPTLGGVSARGDLAYTAGKSQVTVSGADGTPSTVLGKYVTVWRKEADGTWKCAIDTWNSEPAQTPVAAAKES